MTLTIRWTREFGPFTPNQAVQMIKALKRVRATRILTTPYGKDRYVEASVPAQKAPVMAKIAKDLKTKV